MCALHHASMGFSPWLSLQLRCQGFVGVDVLVYLRVPAGLYDQLVRSFYNVKFQFVDIGLISFYKICWSLLEEE